MLRLSVARFRRTTGVGGDEMGWDEKLVYLPNASDNRRSWILATLMLSSSLHEGSAWQRIHRLHRRHPFLRVPHGRHSWMDYLHTQEKPDYLLCQYHQQK